jgi:hypothetical protein
MPGKGQYRHGWYSTVDTHNGMHYYIPEAGGPMKSLCRQSELTNANRLGQLVGQTLASVPDGVPYCDTCARLLGNAEARGVAPPAVRPLAPDVLVSQEALQGHTTGGGASSGGWDVEASGKGGAGVYGGLSGAGRGGGGAD